MSSKTPSSKLSPPIRATISVGRWPEIPAREFPVIPTGTFSPTTATLISGPTEAILVDALFLKEDVQDLGDLIERSGKRLTTIYLTHVHADHYLGFGPVLERFPEARAVALPHVVEAIKDTMEQQRVQWDLLFGDACVTPGPLPDPLEGHTLHVDGSLVEIIEVKQADIHPTTVVHVPDIGVDIPIYEQLWRSGQLAVEGLVSDTIPLEEINRAMDTLDGGHSLRQIITFC